MEFQQINPSEAGEIGEAFCIYSEAFPLNEQQPLELLNERIQKGQNLLYAGRIDNRIVFMALLWPLKNTDFILLDYMATSPDYRGRNIGAHFLQYMKEVLKQDKKYFILEVEDPEYGTNREERERRISFYKRNGVKELKNFRYLLPALQGSLSTEMILMIFPDYDQGRIDSMLVRDLVSKIYQEVYARDAEKVLSLNSYHSNQQIDLI